MLERNGACGLIDLAIVSYSGRRGFYGFICIFDQSHWVFGVAKGFIVGGKNFSILSSWPHLGLELMAGMSATRFSLQKINRKQDKSRFCCGMHQIC